MDIGEIIGKILVFCFYAIIPVGNIIYFLKLLKEKDNKKIVDYIVLCAVVACIIGLMILVSFKEFGFAFLVFVLLIAISMCHGGNFKL